MTKSTVRYADGGFYEGEWKDDIRHGQGTYTWPDGGVYKGEWKDGKKHKIGTYTYVNGCITVEGIYENNICIDFRKIIIQDANGKEHRFFKQDGALYYQIEQETSTPVSDKNKRLELILKQLGNPRTNIEKSDDFIDCKNKIEFQINIQKLIEESKKEGTSPILKVFEFPGHAFVMVFKKGKTYCYDSGAIETNLLYQEYKEVLTSEKAEYKKTSISSKLDFLLQDGNQIHISMSKNSFVCRHLTRTIFDKMQECISEGFDPIGGIERYCKKATEGECMPSPIPLLRCNSWEKDSYPPNNWLSYIFPFCYNCR